MQQIILQWREFQSFQKPDARYEQGTSKEILTATLIWQPFRIIVLKMIKWLLTWKQELFDYRRKFTGGVFFGLKIGFRLFSQTNNLSKTLQTCSSRQVAELFLCFLQGLRNDESFNNFYATVVKDPSPFSFIEEETLLRKRKSPYFLVNQAARAASATTERSFLLAWRVKTWSRSILQPNGSTL